MQHFLSAALNAISSERGDFGLREIIGVVILAAAALMFRHQIGDFVQWIMDYIESAGKEARQRQK